ncbi:hypothetical protein EON62_00850 [archaeon]|nr:MAG: hypothetical protein EON62_00850 [archaeon]
MRGRFQSLAMGIMDQYPQMVGRISGDNYPPPAWKQAAATLLSWAQMGMLMLAIAGGWIVEWHIVAPIRPLLDTILENRTYVIMAALATGMLAQQIVATGAFEVYINGTLEYSTLAHGGKLPSLRNLIFLLQQHGL